MCIDFHAVGDIKTVEPVNMILCERMRVKERFFFIFFFLYIDSYADFIPLQKTVCLCNFFLLHARYLCKDVISFLPHLLFQHFFFAFSVSVSLVSVSSSLGLNLFTDLSLSTIYLPFSELLTNRWMNRSKNRIVDCEKRIIK